MMTDDREIGGLTQLRTSTAFIRQQKQATLLIELELDRRYLLTGWTTVGQVAPSDRGSPETDFVHAVSLYP